MVCFDLDELTRGGGQDGPASRLLGARQLHRARRREDILVASIRVLGEGGHAAFSMRKVAAASGVRLSTVQRFYGDLQTLLVATAQRRVSEDLERFQAKAADDHLPAQDRIRAILDDVFTEVRKSDVTSFYFEVWALGGQNPLVAAALMQLYSALCLMFASIVRQLRPGLSEFDAHVIAALLASVTEGSLTYARFGHSGLVSRDEVALRMREHCLSLALGHGAPF